MHFVFMPAQAVPEWGAAGGEPLVAFGVSVMQGHGQSRSAAFAARADREYERMFDPGHIWVVDVASEDRRLLELLMPRCALHICPLLRSEERRVGKECVRTCRSRWSPYH